MKSVAAYARLLRIPGLGGLAIPPVIAALTVGVYDFYNLAILFGIGVFVAVYGFVLNDYADVELDKLIKELHGKPLVNGSISKKNAIFISILSILFSFLLIFILWRGETLDDFKFAALVCIFLAGILGSFYNLYGKKIIGSDFLVAISVSFVFLFGALSFGEPTIFTWIIFLLTFNNLTHMNAIEGGVKDADHDYMLGVKNIALSSGVKVNGDKIFIPLHFKIFGMGIRSFSAFLLFVPFIFYGYGYYIWQLIMLAIATIGVIYFSVKLLTIKTFDRNIIRRYISIQSFLRYSLVPLMLISVIGTMYSIILIVFPIAWYIGFAPLLGERLFKPRM